MGNPIIHTRGPSVRVVASASTWIEGKALDQLDRVSKHPGMRLSVGMPDLHPGIASPVGAAFLAEGYLHPDLVGSDIGCGMALWTTDLDLRITFAMGAGMTRVGLRQNQTIGEAYGTRSAY